MDDVFKQLKNVLGSDIDEHRLMDITLDIEDPGSAETTLRFMKETWEKAMPFNRYLGITVAEIGFDSLTIRLDMKPELIGNFSQKILHGGAISSVIDLTGGMMAQLHSLKLKNRRKIRDIFKNFMKMSTINMRVDYLRPGSGDHFLCTANVVMFGNKVAVTRMEMRSDDGTLIAIGTASYLVG